MTAPQLLTVGYEGRTADEVIAKLLASEVTVLVDVRLTPLSRKPGLSKRRLAERLQAEGIKYVHLPSLGNPRDNRAPFRANDQAAISRFRNLLGSTDGAASLNRVTTLARDETVALLCFEREPHHCHRQVIADRLTELNPSLDVRHV